MDKKEKKEEQALNEMLKYGMMTAGTNPFNMMGAVAPLILNDMKNNENEEEKESKIRE